MEIPSTHRVSAEHRTEPMPEGVNSSGQSGVSGGVATGGASLDNPARRGAALLSQSDVTTPLGREELPVNMYVRRSHAA